MKKAAKMMMTLWLALGALTHAQGTGPIEIFLPQADPLPAAVDWPQAVRDALGVEVRVSSAATEAEALALLDERAAARNLPDLFILSDRDRLVQWAAQGLLADWSPYTGLMPDFMAARATDDLALLGMASGPMGQPLRYGLAMRQAGPLARAVVAVRQDWLDRLGLAVPVTLDDLLMVSLAFTYDDPNGSDQDDTFGWSGYVDVGSSANPLPGFATIYAAYDALGIWRVDDTSQLQFVPTSDQRREALLFLKQMHDAGVIDWTEQGSPAGWQSGRVGMVNDDFCAIFCPQPFGSFAAANPDGVLVPIAAPVGPYGQGSGADAPPIHYLVMSRQAVDMGKAEPIARLLNWTATEGYVQTRDSEAGPLAYRGGEAELRARYDQPTAYANGQTINLFALLTDAGDLPAAAHQLLPTASEAGISMAELSRFIAENEHQFVIGERSLDSWADYVRELESSFGVSRWVQAARSAAADLGITG